MIIPYLLNQALFLETFVVSNFSLENFVEHCSYTLIFMYFLLFP